MEDLTKQLMRQEGSKKNRDGRHIPYKDTVGKWTCGYGRNLDDVGISEEEALLMLQNDIAKVELQIARTLPWTVNLDRGRYYVLVNMGFNIGIGGLLGFKNMLSCVKEGNFKNASVEMLNSKWAGQVKARATELAKQMETG